VIQGTELLFIPLPVPLKPAYLLVKGEPFSLYPFFTIFLLKNYFLPGWFLNIPSRFFTLLDLFSLLLKIFLQCLNHSSSNRIIEKNYAIIYSYSVYFRKKYGDSL